MNHIQFFKELKNGAVSGAYLFHGEEEYVKDSALKALRATLNEVSAELNYQVIGKAASEELALDELITAADTLPFFDERRIVVALSLVTGSEAEKLIAYLPTLPHTTTLIFFIRGKAKETFSIVQKLRKAERVVQFDPLDAAEASKWVFQNAKRYSATITELAARYMVALAGTDVSTLSNELGKAAAYAGFGNEITKDAVSKCITRKLELKVFAIMDYFLSAKAEDGLKAYRRLLEDGESPFGMAALMEGRFRLMLTAKMHLDSGKKKEQAIKAMGGGFQAKKACEAAMRCSRDEIAQSLLRFADIRYLEVSGQQSAESALELALISCMPKRGAR